MTREKMTTNQFNKKDIINTFNHAAKTYDAAALFQREVAQRLLDHLEPMRLTPKIILDLGAGTGFGTKLLKKRYPKATIISVDIADKMLKQAKRNAGWFQKPLCVCGDIEQSPFQPHSVDLIFSNLTLAWSMDLPKALLEIRRLLRPEGLFLFSTLGTDTLKELRQSWISIDNNIHTHHFVDMHDIGDAMIGAKFLDPVMETEQLAMLYPDVATLMQDLKATGSHNIAKGRSKKLTGKNNFQKFLNAYQNYHRNDNSLPATFEIIYGHAWGPAADIDSLSKIDESGEARISIHQIKRAKS